MAVAVRHRGAGSVRVGGRHLRPTSLEQGPRWAVIGLMLVAAITAGALTTDAVLLTEDAVAVATARPVVVVEPADADNVAPTVTATTAPPATFVELDPGEVLGEMTVTIAATDQRITRSFLADSRTDEQRRSEPIDIHDASLSAGFMLDAAWAFPQLREEYDPATGYPVMSIVAVHRNTVVPDVDGEPTTMHDIDQIVAGDRLEIDLADGSRQVWTATGDHEFLPAGDTFGDLAVSLQSETPRLLMYACDSTEGVPDPELGTYTPDLRRFVLYELTQVVDAPLPRAEERLR